MQQISAFFFCDMFVFQMSVASVNQFKTVIGPAKHLNLRTTPNTHPLPLCLVDFVLHVTVSLRLCSFHHRLVGKECCARGKFLV